MIAMMLRERELAGEQRLSAPSKAVRMGSAPDHPVADRPGAQRCFPRPQISNGYGTTEAGPVVFGPHPEGLPQPELSTGYPHPEVQLRLVRDGREVEESEGVLEMKCGALMTHYHKLPEVTAQGHDAGRLLPHRRRVPPRRQRFLLLRRPRRRHVRVRRREHLSRRGREDAGAPSRHPSGRRDCPCPTSSRATSPSPSWCRRPAPTLDEQAVKDFALANAPAYQHPRRVFFIDEMPLAGTNKIDKRRRWPA